LSLIVKQSILFIYQVRNGSLSCDSNAHTNQLRVRRATTPLGF